MKYLILLILFLNNLYCYDFIKDYISQDNINFQVASYDEAKTKELKEFFIKFDLDLKQLKDKTYYLTIVSDKNSLIYTNTKYEINNNIIVIKLDEFQNKELLFQYKYETTKRPEFRWNTITDFEYNYLLKYEANSI